MDKLRSFKEKVVAENTGGTGLLVKQRKINYIQGKAKFKDSETLEIEKVDGSSDELNFDKV